MAKIPLRAYIKDIENQIERGEVEQAIGHAKNILKSYPKNIDTYRLLGKAFLESQRYGEAADILLRVLSVLPDDFISQIGMSIIREDEGNLDAAIWHMERAYEVQPFNPAVQEELRRLYGRRDGIEPPKIRLTRGALVRMYARGELYSQAIAETRAALAEDPQRLDLLVLLARLYYLSDHKNDAAEVCSELLRKLPYCYEANHLLAEFLPSTNRAEEAQKFLQRIYALDPYAAFVSPNAATSDQVPDQAVMVEQFTWESAMEDARTPEWTRNVGVAWEETAEEALPDWLNTLKPEASSTRSLAPNQPSEDELLTKESAPAAESENLQATKDENIPDWMKDAGWIPSDRKADEVMSAQADVESDEILPGDLPDWVQSIAPRETGQAPEQDERTDWLDTILAQPEGENGKDSGIVPPPEMEKDKSQQGLPDWVTNAGTGTQMPSPSEPPAGDLPDWFSQMDAEKQPGETVPTEDLKPVDFEGLPDWSQLGEPAITEPAQDADATPDWLRSFDGSTPETPAPAEQTPDWLQSLEPETPTQAEADSGITGWLQSVQPESIEPAADLPNWLQTLSGEEETSKLPEALEQPEGVELPEVTDLTKAQQPLDEALIVAASDVLAEIEPPQFVETPMVQPEEAAVAEAAEETLAAAFTPEKAAENVPDFSDMDSAMAWLESLAAKQGADEATLVTRPEDRLEQPPEWVTKEMESQESIPVDAEVDLPAVTEERPILEELAAISAESSSELPDLLQVDETEIELSSAAEEPTAAAEMPSVFDESASQLPDWLQADEAKAVEEPVEFPPAAKAAAQPETAMPDFSDMDSAMAWLESLAAKQGADEATLVTRPEDRLEQPPEWVTKEMEKPEEIPPVAEIEQPAMLEELPLPEATAEPVVDWLEQEETAAPAEIIENVPAAVEPPDQPEASVPDFSDMDAAMAWLELLAAKQGADEATLVTRPENRLEQPPDWVTKEMEAQAPAEPVGIEYPTGEDMPADAEAYDAAAYDTEDVNTAVVEDLPAAEEAELPDWLKDAITEETPVPDEGMGVTESSAPVALEAEPAGPIDLHTIETPGSEIQSAPDSAMDLDSAFAWLESLAEKQGAQEGTLVTTPEERLETPPDWVQREQELSILNEAPPAEAPQFDEQAPFEEPQAVEQLPEEQPAIEETASVQEDTVEADSLHNEEAIPDWLSSIGQDEPAESNLLEKTTLWPGETETVSDQTPSSEPIPEWLKEPALDEIIPTETKAVLDEAPAEAELVPDWLMDLEGSEAEAYPKDVEMPSAPGDFRSAWEPEVEMNQPAAKELADQPPTASSLNAVQVSLNQGDLDRALAGYNSFILSGEFLDETIHDLRDALYRYPVDISIWQTLGDAYARNNQLQEALDAYTKAEELLR